MKLGIIAGTGQLPWLVADEYYKKHNLKSCVAVIAGEGHDQCADIKQFGIGQVGAILDYFTQHTVSHVIMVGAVTRPDFKKLKVDAQGVMLLAKIMYARLFGACGDDTLLRIVAKFIEDKTFVVLSPKDFLEECTLSERVITHRIPRVDEINSITLGMRAAKDLGSDDKGQAVIVVGDKVVLKEGVEGTDALIKSFGALRRNDGILVKAIKPYQDMRLDIPTIGLSTVQNAANVGIVGIAVEAHQVIALDQIKMVDYANTHNMFITGVVV